MRVFIAGIDGYLGWSLAQYLVSRGHIIGGCDDFIRRKCVDEVGSVSAVPVGSIEDRLCTFRKMFGKSIDFHVLNVEHGVLIKNVLDEFKPDAIVHLAEIPSAPYSMIDAHHAVYTQRNNIVGTLNIIYAIKEVCPSAHLIKLGTMGEYGTPNIDIPEGFFEVEYRGRKDILPFPRQAGSWYHQSKVHDSNNVHFACKMFGISSTDIMQGVVFGTKIPEMGNNEHLMTRFDFDQCFGTVINRFCCQAVIGQPLTPFGKGLQRRGFLPLKDSMQCLKIAIENPPKAGEYRVFNQFEEVYSVFELAQKVQEAGNRLGLCMSIKNIENPRIEKEQHYYNPDHQHLFDLGYKPTRDIDSEIELTLLDLMKHKARIEDKKDVLIPDIRWDGTKRKSKVL